MTPAPSAPPRATIPSAVVALVCTTLVACEPAKAPPRPLETTPRTATPRATESPTIDAVGLGSSFQTYASTRFNFSLPLPDGASFRIDDHTDRWLVATHASASSTLLVRVWREYEMMSRGACEDRARLYRTLPERMGDVFVEQKRIDVPPGHDTIVDVYVRERGETPRIEGTVLAFGGWARRCFAFVYVTRDDDEHAVAARLSTIVHGTLLRMTFGTSVVPKQKPPELESRERLAK
ncbi:MAG: hypothetical protein IPM54_22660 [Polyangiaceae bacterium]|nr:hypothetical protein [Polyangiaceae bacterium]